MTTTDRSTLLATAAAWRDDDPDPTTRGEIDELLGRAEDPAVLADLEDRFRGRLEFGTAGLRGVLGAGPNRMNRAVVRAATAGLCAYLDATTPGAKERGFAIGFDGRRLSRELARETAEVALGAGFRVFLFDVPVPTPVVGFTCLAKKTATGVVVTASHNPPEYNGYKVYWENGAQIIPPHDGGIAAKIDAVGPLAKVALVSLEDGLRSGRATMLGEPEIAAYHDAIAKLPLHPETPRDFAIAYTALHGVGDAHVRRALSRAGFTNVHSVAAQAQPDGAFPTVRFPNPEEKGAMDLVLALAAEKGAELVLANDPDADRLAVAARRADGGYTQLTGNDVGTLFAHYLLSEGHQEGRRLVVSSIVSSPMLGAIAAAHGATWEETLTGFKWIANRGLVLEAEGFRFVFGYEEALGYTVGTVVRDKDGVGAALVMADLAAWCRSRGGSLLDELDACARKYGLFVSRQVSVTMKGQDGAAKIRSIMEAVRADPPAALGKHAVAAFVDLDRGERRAGGTTTPLALPPSNAIALELDGGHRVMLRPSGTEPKIKYYFDVKETIGGREHLGSARERAERTLSALVEAFLARIGGAA